MMSFASTQFPLLGTNCVEGQRLIWKTTTLAHCSSQTWLFQHAILISHNRCLWERT